MAGAGLEAFLAALLSVLPGHPSHGHGKGPREQAQLWHATGSKQNPYVPIVISPNGLNGHSDHQDGGDVILA
jgi:hypothetical protein